MNKKNLNTLGSWKIFFPQSCFLSLWMDFGFFFFLIYSFAGVRVYNILQRKTCNPRLTSRNAKADYYHIFIVQNFCSHVLLKESILVLIVFTLASANYFAMFKSHCFTVGVLSIRLEGWMSHCFSLHCLDD